MYCIISYFLAVCSIFWLSHNIYCYVSVTDGQRAVRSIILQYIHEYALQLRRAVKKTKLTVILTHYRVQVGFSDIEVLVVARSLPFSRIF